MIPKTRPNTDGALYRHHPRQHTLCICQGPGRPRCGRSKALPDSAHVRTIPTGRAGSLAALETSSCSTADSPASEWGVEKNLPTHRRRQLVLLASLLDHAVEAVLAPARAQEKVVPPLPALQRNVRQVPIAI